MRIVAGCEDGLIAGLVRGYSIPLLPSFVYLFVPFIWSGIFEIKDRKKKFLMVTTSNFCQRRQGARHTNADTEGHPSTSFGQGLAEPLSR